jgi:hypothetical protein
MDNYSKIRDYIRATPLVSLDTKAKRSAFYRELSKKFKISWQTAVGIYITTQGKPTNTKKTKAEKPERQDEMVHNVVDGIIEYTRTVDRKITLDEAIKLFEIDQTKWEVAKFECKVWDFSIKDKDGNVETQPQYSAGLMVKQRVADKDLYYQKQIILNELKDIITTSSYSNVVYPNRSVVCELDSLLEISIPDLHIGKHSWGQETGEDYDIKIAVDRYNVAIDALISRVNTAQVERILLPIGNDMINIDSKAGTTTSGTPQSVDSRFGKMFRTAKDLIINTIGKLSSIAPVDVVVVAGNHDNLTMFTLGEVLEAFFHENPQVRVNNSPKQRKYYRYGVNGILFSHGNEEKHPELGLIFATEEPEMWAQTKFREVQLGHYHKTKRTNYISVDEHQGFKIRIIASLSGTDAWHYSKGYNSMKSAQAFLYHKDKGLLAEYTYNV